MPTDTGQLGDTIPTLIEEAQYTQEFKAIMRGLSWNIKKGKGSNVNVPYFGSIVAAQLTEGVDMTAEQKMVDTNVQIVPYEVGLKIILTDNVIEDDNEDLKRAAGRLVGDAYERKRDEDLLGQLDDATNSSNNSGGALTMGDIAAGRATVDGNPRASGGPAPTPYAAVIHPFQELDIVDILTPLVPSAATAGLQAPGSRLADEIIGRYSIGRLFGMPVVSDGNLAFTASATKGGVFATGRGGAMIYVSAREPNIETERDASLRGWELNYVGRYGVSEYLPGWIYELFTDATQPA